MKSQTKIKAILFDFMGVLLFQKDNYQPNKMIDEIDQIISKVTNDSVFKKETLEHYKLNEKEFDKILDKIIDKYKKFQSLWKLLPELRKKYKLAIINNGTALTLQKLNKRHSVNENFDLFISSATEGVRKPNSEIFLLTAHRLCVEPEECLFMDNLKQNTDGARKIGMKAIWWKNKELGFNSFLEFLENEDFAGKEKFEIVLSSPVQGEEGEKDII